MLKKPKKAFFLDKILLMPSMTSMTASFATEPNRHIPRQDSSMFTQFCATEKSHYFPELHLPVNTINRLFQSNLLKDIRFNYPKYIHFLSCGVLMTARFPLENS